MNSGVRWKWRKKEKRLLLDIDISCLEIICIIQRHKTTVSGCHKSLFLRHKPISLFLTVLKLIYFSQV